MANQAASGLHHFLQARIGVGVIKASAKLLLQMLAQGFIERIDLRQAEGGDHDPLQVRPGQINGFGKSATEYGQTEEIRPRLELLQPVLLRRLAHVTLLAVQAQLRPLGCQQAGGLLQIGKAGKKRQPVATVMLAHAGQQPCQRGQAGRALLPAGGQIIYADHL